MGVGFIACRRLHIPNERGITMVKYEYDVPKSTDVMRELLIYEARMTERLERAQANVNAIRAIIQRAKERRLDIEIQSSN